MFQVTDRAVDKMEEMRTERDPESGQGLMLVVTESNQLAIALGSPGEEDQVYEREGEPVVIVPAALNEALDGLSLDYSDPEGFVLGPVEGDAAPA